MASTSEHIRYYKSGLDAVENQDWNQVDTLMQRAIAEKPEEKRRGVFRRGGYFPHYYLGLARYYRGDCPGALASWAESENQGVIIGRSEYAELLRLQSDCQKNRSPTIASGSPEATDTSGKGGKSGKDKVRTTQRWVEKLADPASKTLQALEGVAPADSDLGKTIRTSRSLVDAAGAATDLVDVAMAPAKKLEFAINAYFAGKPVRTLAYLEAVDLSDSRARAQVHLFRAAANFRLHLIEGRDETRLAEARKNGNLFQQQQWRSDFPTELFDPRFVRFLRAGD
jgi:hypothetical protein